MRRTVRSEQKPRTEDFTAEQAMELEGRRIHELTHSIAAEMALDWRDEEEAGCADARASARRAPATSGVHSGNTPPSSSKLDDFKNWIGAEDWFEVNFYVNWKNWNELKSRLDKAKENALVKDAPEGWNEIWFWGGRASLEPGGARLGKKNKGPYMAYKLAYEELNILIADRELAHKTLPSVNVCISGCGCLYPGAATCYKKAVYMIEELGGTIIRNVISRVDLCLDLPEVPIKRFAAAFFEGRYISRSRNDNAYVPNKGTGSITLYFGSSPLQCRIYDKKAEIEQKPNPTKNLCMRLYRWQTRKMPSAATRIEFELRRETLKKRGMDSVEDYYAKRADLIDYLTHDWLRFTTDKVDRENKNQSKAKTLPLWKNVQKAFKNWTGEPPGKLLEPLPKEQADVRNLIKQAVGVCKTAAEYQGKNLKSIEDLIEYVKISTSAYGIKLKPQAG